MIAEMIAALGLAAAQPAGPPTSLSVQLCNETPARVAFSATYPGGTGETWRRGWFTVEPGDCLSGAVGRTVGGQALVHARSGSYRWPAESEDQVCLPANSHNQPANAPPCADGEAQEAAAPVPLTLSRGRHVLSYTARCSDLPGIDAELCASGRTDAQGFAELVRTAEVCNLTTQVVALAWAGQEPDGGFLVQGWRGLEPGACSDVWRGLTQDRVTYVYNSVVPGTANTPGAQTFCVDRDQAFEREVAGPESSCEDGLVPRPFRPLEFGPNVRRMTLDLEELEP